MKNGNDTLLLFQNDFPYIMMEAIDYNKLAKIRLIFNNAYVISVC